MDREFQWEVWLLKKETLVAMGIFNVLFVIAEIMLYSRGIGNLGARPAAAGIGLVISLAVFVGVNYGIMKLTGKRRIVRLDKLRDVQDYRDALENWIGKNNPFNPELEQAIRQLDLFYQKQTALKALLAGQSQDGDSPFMSVSDDVQGCLFANMKRLLNRMTILDPEDHGMLPVHTEFIHHVLGQNKQLLSQYDNLIIEISQIGDSRDLENLNLENITEALRELRNDSSAPRQELMQQGGED